MKPGIRSKPLLAAVLIAVVVSAGCLGSVSIAAAAVRPPKTRQRLTLVLPLRVDGAGLHRLATAVSDPTSPSYGHYEPIATLAKRFGASAAIRRKVLRYLRAHGASDVRVDATGLFVSAKVRVADAEQLFDSPVESFHAARRRAYVMATGRPRIPDRLRGAVTGVIGLDTRTLTVQPQIQRAHTLAAAGVSAAASSGGSSALARTGTPAGCAAGRAAGETGGDPTTAGFTPNQYLTAYGFDPLHRAGDLGQGQRVAMVELDGVDRSDLDAFARCFGLSVPPISQHLLGLRSAPQLAPDSDLDVEVLDAAAPKLSGIDVYVTKNNAVDFIKALTAPLQSARARPSVIAVPLGFCDEELHQLIGLRTISLVDYAFQEAAAAGTTVMAESGDTGSTTCPSADGEPLYDPSLVLHGITTPYPASSYAVLAVGGTNLALTPANRIAREVVWNDGPLQPLGAGGGGFDPFYPRPPWQKQFISRRVGTRGEVPVRALPDAAMLADPHPGYAIYCSTFDCRAAEGGGAWLSAGGTGAATALLAGGIALVDQVLATHARVQIGLPTPLLYYKAERAATRRSIFHDVTTGSNDLGPFLPGSGGASIGCCVAKPGYDEASGFGSVDISHLAQMYLNATLLNAHLRVGLSYPRPQHPIHAGRLAVVVSCSTACPMYAFVFITIGSGRVDPGGAACVTAHGCYGLSSRTRDLSSSGSTRFVLTFPPGLRTALRAALRRHVRAYATVYGEVNDVRGILFNSGTPARSPGPERAKLRIALTS